MAWTEITEDDWRSSINEPEETAVRAGMIASGQADPFGVVARQVTDLVRNAIRSGPGNRLDPDATKLPPSANFHAVALIRFRLLTRFASELLDDDRRLEQKQAMDWLKEVRRGFEKIEAPDGDGTDTATPMIEVRSNHERQATRDNLRGL